MCLKMYTQYLSSLEEEEEIERRLLLVKSFARSLITGIKRPFAFIRQNKSINCSCFYLLHSCRWFPQQTSRVRLALYYYLLALFRFTGCICFTLGGHKDYIRGHVLLDHQRQAPLVPLHTCTYDALYFGKNGERQRDSSCRN